MRQPSKKTAGMADERRIVGELLKQIRLESNLTQAVLARRLRVPQSFVSKYESGERRIDVLEARTICAALGMSMSDFTRRLDEALE